MSAGFGRLASELCGAMYLGSGNALCNWYISKTTSHLPYDLEKLLLFKFLAATEFYLYEYARTITSKFFRTKWPIAVIFFFLWVQTILRTVYSF